MNGFLIFRLGREWDLDDLITWWLARVQWPDKIRLRDPYFLSFYFQISKGAVLQLFQHDIRLHVHANDGGYNMTTMLTLILERCAMSSCPLNVLSGYNPRK